MAQLCSWYKEIDLLHVVSDRTHLGCWNIWQKHLLLGELCSLSVGLKVLFKGNSNQWVVDVMQKVFCRNPRHNGFGLLKSFILFYRWRSLAGSWAKNQTQVSGDISEAFFVHGQSDCLLTWLQNSPVCNLCPTVISADCCEFRLPRTTQWSIAEPKRSSSPFHTGSSHRVLVRDLWVCC